MKHETVGYGCGLKALKKHGLGPMLDKLITKEIISCLTSILKQ
nr:MAG TPA: hypothetical protein [Caudoviricetes sp.]